MVGSIKLAPLDGGSLVGLLRAFVCVRASVCVCVCVRAYVCVRMCVYVCAGARVWWSRARSRRRACVRACVVRAVPYRAVRTAVVDGRTDGRAGGRADGRTQHAPRRVSLPVSLSLSLFLSLARARARVVRPPPSCHTSLPGFSAPVAISRTVIADLRVGRSADGRAIVQSFDRNLPKEPN